MNADTSTEAVEKLLDEVTPGHWRVEYKHGTTCLMMGDSCQMCNETYYPWVPANERDWHFIAAARDLVPALLAERDALRRENENLRQIERNVQAVREHDMIRRGDALKALDWRDIYGRAANTQTAINAIPSVQPTVKSLDWVELEKYRRGGKYSADGYTIRYVEGFFILDFAGEGKWKWRWTDLDAAKAAAQADYEARVMAALDVQPLTVQDAVKVPEVKALIEKASDDAHEVFNESPAECGEAIDYFREHVLAALRAITEGRE